MTITALSLGALLAAAAMETPPAPAAGPSGPLQQKLAPALARYTDDVLFGTVWPSPGLSPRDRSLIVISALIATNKPAQLTGHLNRALANGVTPVEASGVLTHLAFYAGWPNAVSALEVYDRVYTDRKIDVAALQAKVGRLADDDGFGRSAEAALAPTAPKFARLSEEVVFGDLWRRSDLSARDRALVTIAALTAMGEADQLAPYLRRGREAGLKPAEVTEAITHLAFYAGWPRATEALGSVARTLEAKP
ncbi:MAG: carboxymuconolactone decarboxylase family protein [Phenylobacterium sp.]|uniref:carboxymuconolactone decarboxylase family protein n=1 Tax=Phenylobacterium sp. TaxID=1871053 RepID=UPI001A631B4F|nr:carboxymuconolactone decarboxylase family protein [Phenylobacterium sp.]MBL8555345.1 carboxymuconolactone decarboxylase family protein [Phenylobacterium sp.]